MKTRRPYANYMMRRMLGRGFLHIQKIPTVAKGLDEQKSRVKQQRHGQEKDFLFGRKCWAAGRRGEIWQHQTKHSQRHDDVEVSVDTLNVVMLFAISKPTKYQRKTHQAVKGNHDYGEDCVASQCWIVFAM